ncbi:MAG TPA: alpha/beta fold hydrolase [Paracoccaceae bacterium]|nr:alpha/beta fold hydrolase [Paracoccaceae bacterium]
MTIRLSHQVYQPEGPETAPPLIIAHGLFGSARNFQTLAQKLAKGRRVLVVDMRNHGESPWAESMDYNEMGQDLGVLIKDHAGGSAIVLGHSMGGKAAMALALTRPDLVAGLIVADIAPVAYTHSHLGYVQAMQGVDLSGISRRSEADSALAETIPQPMLRAFLLQSLAVRDGEARWQLNLDALETGMGQVMGWPENLSGKSYDGPSLFIHGGASEHEVAKSESVIRNLFPKAELQEIKGAGHWLHAEKPAEFLDAVESWLARL